MAAMENVLDLYAEPYDPQRPVVCFDETSTQFLADLRPSIPAAPGRPRREDYEYLRAGTRNLFLTCQPPAELVAAYLLELAEEREVSVATIRLHKAALAAIHRSTGHEDPHSPRGSETGRGRDRQVQGESPAAGEAPDRRGPWPR